MAKIQVSTVRQLTDVQVINVSSRLVCLAVKAQITLESLINSATSPSTKWDDKACEWIEQKDENGNTIMSIGSIDGAKVSEDVLPFLKELVDALKDDELPLRFRVVLVKKHGGSLERQAFYVSSSAVEANLNVDTVCAFGAYGSLVPCRMAQL